MPARLSTETRVIHGNRSFVVGTDKAWRFGPVEGGWYIGMFIFAILVLLYNLALPWCYETATGSSWRFRNVSPAATVPATPVAIPQWKSYADCIRGYVLTAGKDPEGACDSLPH